MKQIALLLILMNSLLAACSGGILTATPSPRDDAEAVLRAVAERACPYPDDPDEIDLYIRHFTETDSAYMFACSPAMGHDTVAKLSWFGNQDEAYSAFEDRREADADELFHNLPLAVREKDHPSFPGGRKEYQTWLWQAQEWLIEVRAFDDTHFLIAPDPETFSEFIYQVGVERGLFTVIDQ